MNHFVAQPGRHIMVSHPQVVGSCIALYWEGGKRFAVVDGCSKEGFWWKVHVRDANSEEILVAEVLET